MGRLLVRDLNNAFNNLTLSSAIDIQQTVGLRGAYSPKWNVRDDPYDAPGRHERRSNQFLQGSLLGAAGAKKTKDTANQNGNAEGQAE